MTDLSTLTRRAFLSAAMACLTTVAQAQIPDTFKNLQILPKDSTKAQVVEVMRNFAGGLGVRCNHCHVGENAATLEGFDFASDEKEAKKIARVMMKMTREINEKLLPATGRSPLVEVRCVTCHRGLVKPETLDRVLLATASEKGVTAALDKYRELRTSSLGQGGYDFSPRTLRIVAETLANQRNDTEGAAAATRLNLEFNPGDAGLHLMLAEILASKGDKEGALASYRKVLELQPENKRAKAQVEALTAPTAPK